MAKYRQVYCEFWRDTKVSEEMTPEDRYFMLYLLTNSHANQIGVYEISKKVMAFELGYTQESVNAVMDRFIHHHKLVKYNSETREIALRNWGKFNYVRGGKPVLDLMTSELRKVKDAQLLRWVFDNYVESAGSTEELTSSVCDLLRSFLEQSGQTLEIVMSDEPCHESCNESINEASNDTCSEAGAISISINNNIKDLKHIVHSEKNALLSKKEEADQFFDDIWALYPHKKGKGQIKDTHKAVLLKHGKAKLVRAIERYKAYVETQRKGGFMLQYQNGSTFFYSGFKDYLADDYVEVATIGTKLGTGAGQVSGGQNRFHNFEQSKKQYDDKALNSILRNRTVT